MSKETVSKKLVVIAEDSLTQAENLRHMLEGFGYSVIHTTDGKGALEAIRKHRPAFVISDIIMPVMDGFTLCRTVKEDKLIRDIPFILLTSLSDPNDVIRGLECGADSYMMKTFSESYLLSRINQVLENRHLLAGNKDDRKLEVSFAGKQYQISSNPLQIMNLLLSTYDSVVQKNIELADQESELINLNRNLQKQVEERKKELTAQLEQKIAAEKILELSEEKYRELVDNALTGIFISNMKGEILFANEALREMLEYDSVEELLDTNIHIYYKNSGDSDRLLGLLQEFGVVPEFEVEYLTKNGNTKHVILSANLDNDTISGMIMDMTDRKNAELRVKKFQDELIQAREKAEQSEKLKTAFLANMSNEILTPMNSLIGFSELLAEHGPASEKLEEYTGHINDSGNYLINLIDNIIDVAKIESGEVTIKKSECNINHLLIDLYTYYEEELRVKNKSEVKLFLKRGRKEQDFAIITESYRLKQVLSNLIGNAIKYTDSGSVVFGYTMQDGDTKTGEACLQFFVKDTGRGISVDRLDRIFDRFEHSGDSFLKQTDGAGMGLPISRSYVQLLGGRMWCQSEPGKGTEFYFTHPFRALIGGSTEDEISKPPEVSVKLDEFTILLAEDVESNFIYLEALLQDTNCNLIWAKNGKEAIDKFKDHQDISLILMDIRMPGMSGYEAIDEIRKLNQDIPIIIQTAFAREDDRQKIESSGCNDFITKPISKEVLMQTISKYLVTVQKT